ncbi:MAG: putative methyltransferase [Phycisphaerales bacterium]|nr:putative methyltransferase [Phycisphaerales bacterium]
MEIGALHNPLRVPRQARVSYVDRMSTAALREHYPELAGQDLVTVDIIDNGENLATLAPASQDFVIANHFLEHCQDPIGSLGNMLRVVRPGGTIYMAVPDKRFTFDVDREVTSLDHLLADHERGPAATRRQHFAEWVRFVSRLEGPAAEAELDRLSVMDYSIHYHVWDFPAFLGFLTAVRERLGFEIELTMRNGQEILNVLRKPASRPDPA